MASEKSDATDTLQRHFDARHYEGVPSGPFPFLNPTHRRFSLSQTPAQSKQAPKEGVQDGRVGSMSSAARTRFGKEEVASAVDQKWRSRDNRKGKTSDTLSTPSWTFVHHHEITG
jgi:hypothetical protein